MKVILSCPSKTFLLGEYSVLNFGSALLFNSEPRFQLIADMRGSGEVLGIHPSSPAGLWLARNRGRHWQHADLQFVDPHNGMGGFGASSAQFLLVHALAQLMADSNHKKESVAIQVEPIWRDYRELCLSAQSSIESSAQSSTRPSGADIVAQFAGGICEVNLEPFSFQQLDWPFDGFDLVIARTGQKVLTHEHLNDVRQIDADELNWILQRGLEAFETKDEQAFFDSINDYYTELLELGLVADHSQTSISTLIAQPFVEAVKGCGALGGDTIAVFFATENRARINRILSELHMPVVSDLSGLSHGFRIRIDDADRPASAGTPSELV